MKLGLFSLALLLAAPPLHGAKRASELAPPSTTDRVLFQEAQQAALVFKRSPKLQAQRVEWEKLVQRFRRIVIKYPQSGYADDALLMVGDLSRQMAARFKSSKYRDDAVDAYQSLAESYPRSKLGEPALYAVFEIANESGERKRSNDTARDYLEAFPDGPHAAALKATLKKRAPAPAPEPPLPTPPPPGVAQVFSLRSWSGESSTRVVLDVEKELPFKYDRLSNPDRLFVDIQGARLHANLKDRSFPVGDGLLEQVRLAQNRDSVVRVVLDFKSVKEHQIFYLRDPMRLVIDVKGTKLAPVETVRVADQQPLPEAEAVDQITGSRRITGMLPAEPKPAPSKKPTRIVLEGSVPPPEPKPTPTPSAVASAPQAPAAPQSNRSGQYSLARQLGLGARRIVIDAGHGGHDPGTIGSAGLQEKDLVLDVALRLDRMVREELRADVVMTRASDVFIPLEERTAIANAKGADLFLSIHANSSRNPTARGIETYFLNFAKNPHAEEVAARENAISPATLKDLQTLVKAITLNSKIDESRDFAASVQEALIQNIRARDSSVPDRGVHTAPFYVLIGANMPSILAEIAFVSHPGDERLLKTGEYREAIARSLFQGVRSYLDSLNRSTKSAPTIASAPQRTLTPPAPRPRVAERSKSR